jgi:CBS domain-containing protein
MARDVITVKPTDNLDYCMELMSTKESDTYVLENNAVLGVISIGDVVKSIIEIQKTIQYLDLY